MYPKPVQDLAGWNISHVGASFTSIVVAADETCIAWGASPTYGELGIGDMQKSSTTPKEVGSIFLQIPKYNMYRHKTRLDQDISGVPSQI